MKNMVTGEGGWGRCPHNRDIGEEMTGGRSQISKGMGEEVDCSGLRDGH